MPPFTLPVTLEGTHVRLEPLGLQHLEPLCAVGLDPAIWEKATSVIRTEADMRRYILTALEWHAQGTALAFAIVDRSSHTVVGSTRYANIDEGNKRLEIGWTWIGRPWQRTYVNTEAKYLLLCHAFETLGCVRVEFKTDALNTRSRAALTRIGATEEGTLRNHMIVEGGRYRNSVYFSIIEQEWTGVKHRLEAFLGRKPDSL